MNLARFMTALSQADANYDIFSGIDGIHTVVVVYGLAGNAMNFLFDADGVLIAAE